jgi:hypothetical protein
VPQGDGGWGVSHRTDELGRTIQTDDAGSWPNRKTTKEHEYLSASNDFVALPVVDNGVLFAASIDGNIHAVGSAG